MVSHRSDERGTVRRAAEGVYCTFPPRKVAAFGCQEPVASRLARQLQQLTGVEARVTSLGHVQRGGPPTRFDRLLCTRFGTKAGELLADRHYNIMVGMKGTEYVPVPLKKVAGIKRVVPPNHPWLRTARLVETCLGDRA